MMLVQRHKARLGVGRKVTAFDGGLVVRLESTDDGKQILADALIHLRLPRPALCISSLEDPISLHQLFLQHRKVLAARPEMYACQTCVRVWALTLLDR